MEVTFDTAEPATANADALIVPVASGDGLPVWSPLATELDVTLSGQLSLLATDARFSGKAATTLVLPTLGRVPSRRIIFAGLGSAENLGEATVTRMAGAAVRAARDAGARRLAIAVSAAGIGIDPLTALEAAALGVSLALYRFDHYRGEAAPESANGRQVESVQ
ncbi:MAG TPA: M17 family peptidase N-terminal domain-containing protein, partial [Thermomicrobiales bacterium]|nr:M17 family peptidase N-terminal domain-containing protein [Thermomicrobiales bacterium]